MDHCGSSRVLQIPTRNLIDVNSNNCHHSLFLFSSLSPFFQLTSNQFDKFDSFHRFWFFLVFSWLWVFFPSWCVQKDDAKRKWLDGSKEGCGERFIWNIWQSLLIQSETLYQTSTSIHLIGCVNESLLLLIENQLQEWRVFVWVKKTNAHYVGVVLYQSKE